MRPALSRPGCRIRLRRSALALMPLKRPRGDAQRAPGRSESMATDAVETAAPTQRRIAQALTNAPDGAFIEWRRSIRHAGHLGYGPYLSRVNAVVIILSSSRMEAYRGSQG